MRAQRFVIHRCASPSFNDGDYRATFASARQSSFSAVARSSNPLRLVNVVPTTIGGSYIKCGSSRWLAAQIADDLRPVAFGKAIDLLAGRTPSTLGQPGTQEITSNGDGGADADQRLVKIAQRISVDASKLAYIYDPDTDDVALIVQRSKLSSSKAKATREVALLYSAARQAAGYDETHTALASIKGRVEDMGVFDENNFASHVKKTDGLSQRGQTPSTREYKVTQHGFEEAAKIINRITGGES